MGDDSRNEKEMGSDGRSKKPETLLPNCVIDGGAYALSLTSGEYRLLLLITLSSQRIESLGKPVRFTEPFQLLSS